MRSQTGKIDVFFSEILNHTIVGLIEKGFYSQEKCWFEAVIYLIWKLIKYANYHSLDACVIPTF